MAKKFYAVKTGKVTGVFETWDECKESVNGYPNAEFKGFATLAQAQKYLGINEQLSLFDTDEIPETTAVAYTDGSYNAQTKEFSYGLIIFFNGRDYTFSEAMSDDELSQMRNVAGEIKGAQAAMQFCIDNNINTLELYYDYEGIAKWCTGEWKTNKSGTIAYKQFYDSIKDKLTVSFNKVKGHSGDKYNDMADRLAKDALGIE